ncbi:MAG: flagellar biosynthetic protein FliR [Thiobacillus sp.]|nr:flagellar biosynthetic protein FliR [Thiobacillus sp.]
MPLSESHLAVWILAFARLAGWTLFDPLVGRLPISLRLLVAAVLAAVLTPGLSLTTLDPFTVQGIWAMSLEVVWGAALALCVWLVFAAIMAAWVWTGHSATGGILNLTEEQAAPADAAWRNLAGWLAAMAFLGASGHLLVVDALRESFVAMPVAVLPAADDLRQIAKAASWLFATGVQLALPLVALVLLIQLAFGMVARTTRGLDIFSVGLAVGVLSLMVMWIWAVPLVAIGMEHGLAQLMTWLGTLTTR